MKAALLALFAVMSATFAIAAPATQSAAPAVGDVAPDFTLKTVDGKPVSLHQLSDKGPIVLIVLRGWVGYQCPVCTKQVASFMAAKDDIAAAKARVLMVYPGPAEKLDAHAQAFLKHDLPAHFDFVLDPDFTFTNQYGLRWDAKGETAYPSTFVIDPQHKVRFAKISKSHGGRASVDEVLQALRQPE